MISFGLGKTVGNAIVKPNSMFHSKNSQSKIISSIFALNSKKLEP